MIFDLNFTELAPGIYVYHNFLSKKEVDELYCYSKSLKEDEWNMQSKGGWFDEKMTGPTDKLLFLYKKINNLIQPNYKILPSLNIRRLRKGENMYLHSDSPEDGDENYNKKNTTINYGIIAYFNDDYDGGEIYYPKKGLSYKPIAGDLVIHGSGKDCEHGVKEVIEGIRYCYSTFIIPSKDDGLFSAMLYKEYKIIEQRLKNNDQEGV